VTVDWTGTPSVSISAPSRAVRGSAFDVVFFTNVVPCTASGGEQGDSWTGQFADANEVISVVEQTAGTKTYTITCGSGAQTVTASTSVDILAAAPQVTLTPAYSEPIVGTPVTLTWSSNMSPCVLGGGRAGDGWTGTFGSAGSLTVTETTPDVYVFFVTCGTYPLTAAATASVKYGFVPAPTLTASKTEVGVGESITLTWASADGSTCTATGGSSGDGWQGNRGAGGSVDVREPLAGTVLFVLVCGQSFPASLTIKIDPPQTADPSFPPIVQLTANPTTAQVNDPITLTWTTTPNTQTCTASGGSADDGWNGPLSKDGGSETLRETLARRYEFGITCQAGYGASASATVVVIVNPATTTPSPTPSTSSGGGGGGAMGPIDVAFFLALFVCALWQRRRPASISERDRSSRTSA